MRVFLDTCTFQFLYDYGEYIFESNRSAIDQSIEEYPNGERNLEALHDMMQVNSAGAPSFSFVLSGTSIEEIENRGNPDFTKYGYDVLDTWKITVTELGNDAFSGEGHRWAEVLQQDQFEYLSNEDRRLIADALLEECECFLTVEEKLPKHADHLSHELPIELLRPYEFWEQKLEPHFKNYPPWRK